MAPLKRYWISADALSAQRKPIVKGFAECDTFREISRQLEEDHAQIARLNQTGRPLPVGQSIVSLFRQQAARTPDNAHNPSVAVRP